MATLNLIRFEQFLAIPTEDIAARAQFAFSHSETDELHTLAVNGEASWDLYHQVNNAQKADFIYRNSGQERGWSIGFIREQLGRTAYRHYSRGGEDIHEWISGRLFPKGWHIERIRSQKDPLRIIQEVELAFSPETDLEELWKQQRLEFEQEGIELLQQFPDNQFVQDLCFLPGDQNMEVRFIISAGARRKELIFPIALRYEPLLKKLETTYRLEVTKQRSDPDKPLQRASTEELQEALTALSFAAKTYDRSEGSITAYMEMKTTWHMKDRFKERSKKIKDSATGKTRRILKDKLERTGGLLDDPRYGKDGSDAGTLEDTIEDRQAESPDRRIFLQEILDSLVDETDRKIVHLRRDGHTQKEIAQKLGRTQPAIAKRLKRIRERPSR